MAKAWGHSRSGIKGLRPHLISAHTGAKPPARLLHRLPSLNGVVPQHPPPSHRLRRAGRNPAVGPNGDPLRMHGCRVGLEVTELLLLLGIQPPLTTRLFWRLVEAAVLVLTALSVATRQKSGFLRKLNHVAPIRPQLSGQVLL